MNEDMKEWAKAHERPWFSWVVELFVSLTLICGCVYLAVLQREVLPLAVGAVGAYILHHAFTPPERTFRQTIRYKGNDEAEG